MEQDFQRMLKKLSQENQLSQSGNYNLTKLKQNHNQEEDIVMKLNLFVIFRLQFCVHKQRLNFQTEQRFRRL